MIKRVISLILVLVIIATLTGCDKDKTTQVMGRYVEEGLTLPEGVTENRVVFITKNTDNELVLYVTEYGLYYKYTLHENEWVSEPAKWLSNENVSRYNRIFYGQDGNQYALCYYNYNTMKLLKTQDGIEYEIVKLPFDQTTEDIRRPRNVIFRCEVLRNGDIALTLSDEPNLYIVSSDGNILHELNYAYSFKAAGDSLLVSDVDNRKILIYDSSSDYSVTEKDNIQEIFSNQIIFPGENEGEIYIADNKGIHLLEAGGTIWQTIFTGDTSYLDMSTCYLQSMFVVDQVFYATYCDLNTGKEFIKQYRFDPTAEAVAETAFSIYSLNENEMIRDAVINFQAKHPEVRVQYYVAMETDEGLQGNDYIRAFNTELMAGRGADIILLDGMPVEDYIEKGLLKDITYIIEPLATSEEFMSNIIEPFKTGGIYYNVPISFGMPVAYGNKELLELATLEGINGFNQDENKSLSITSSLSELVKFYVITNMDIFINAGKFDDEIFQRLLLDINSVKQLKPSIDGQEKLYWKPHLIEWGEKVSASIMDYFLVNYGDDFVGVADITTLHDVNALFTVINTFNGEFSTIKHQYIPYGLVGVNASTKNNDLVEEFINYLFSEEVQSMVPMGLPVNNAALINVLYKNLSDVDPSISPKVFFTCECTDSTVYLHCINIDEAKLMFEVLHSVNTPITYDSVLIDFLLDETEAYFDGTKTASETAQSIKQQVETYLAE